MKNAIYLLLLLGMSLTTGCVTLAEKSIQSTTSLKQYQFAEVDSLMAKEKRAIAVFLHAKWCKFCKNMEQTTLQNKEVIQTLNQQYYFVSFDGEQKEAATFRNRRFQYQPTGRDTGTHELATALGNINGELIYPTFVVLNSNYEIVFQHNAFLSSDAMNEVLVEGIKK